MYPDGIGGVAWFLVVINTIWLLGLTVLVWKKLIFIRKLFPKQPTGNLVNKLEEVLVEFKGMAGFKKQSLKHLQQVALKRYNPYQDTGGDQSFSVALLDGKRDGVVISSLHSRASTRVFAKPVKNGAEDEVHFSQEEKEVVEQALKN